MHTSATYFSLTHKQLTTNTPLQYNIKFSTASGKHKLKPCHLNLLY